jgi:hypothetical protein
MYVLSFFLFTTSRPTGFFKNTDFDKRVIFISKHDFIFFLHNLNKKTIWIGQDIVLYVQYGFLYLIMTRHKNVVH